MEKYRSGEMVDPAFEEFINKELIPTFKNK